jgi:hypothetical protein
LDFLRFIHINQNASGPAVDARAVADEIAIIFPSCEIDIRPPFKYDDKMAEWARIANIRQPFENQPKRQQQDSTMILLYDGFAMQKIFADKIFTAEISLAHIHVIFTNLLICTFSEDDWRYHGRAVICGTPSIISTTGIVEAVAKPREFYLPRVGSMTAAEDDNSRLKKKLAGRFIDYDDVDRITGASINYALQAIFFFITGGEPFCNNKDCRLYNAHWQEELINTIEKGVLCSHHRNLANKFVKESDKD